MAWTAPRTWVAGETVTAALLNTHIRDNEKAIGDPWTAYTPTLTASTTNPTLGSGSSATGGYIAAGKLIIGWAKIQFGTSGVAAGSGTYRISVPATAATASRVVCTTAWLFDSSAGAVAMPNAQFTGNATYLTFNYPATWPSGASTAATHAAPWAWAASDTLEVAFVYEAA